MTWNGISHEGLLPGGVYGQRNPLLTPTPTQVCESSYTGPYYCITQYQFSRCM